MLYDQRAIIMAGNSNVHNMTPIGNTVLPIGSGEHGLQEKHFAVQFHQLSPLQKFGAKLALSAMQIKPIAWLIACFGPAYGLPPCFANSDFIMKSAKRAEEIVEMSSKKEIQDELKSSTKLGM